MKIWILCTVAYLKTHSSQRFREEAKKHKVDIAFVHPEHFEIITTATDGRNAIYYKGKHVRLPDVCIPRMGADTTYFDLAVIRHLRQFGVMVLNSGRSIEVSKDKLHSLQLLARYNFPVPKTLLAKFPLDFKVIEREFEFPIIIKTIAGTEGDGIMMCENADQLKDITGILSKSTTNVILQEFIKDSFGRDLRIIVVGGRPLAVMMRKAKTGFKANFSVGGEVKSYPMSSTIQWLAVESAQALGLDIAGVDLLFDGKEYKICEINSAPDFKGFELANPEINVPKEIFEYASLRLTRTR